MSNPQGRHDDLHHAHTHGTPIPELSRRTLIPPHTLRCMLDHETCDNCGGPDDEIRDTDALRRALRKNVLPVPGVHDVLGGVRE